MAEYAECSEEEAIEELQTGERYDIASLKSEEILPFYYQTAREAVQAARRGLQLSRLLPDGTSRDDVPEDIFKQLMQSYKRLREKTPVKDAWVRLPISVLWDLDRGRWKWDLFVVYCAILSKIGNKARPIIIRYAELEARVLGYLKAEYAPVDIDTSLGLSIDQIRYRIERLEQKGLIATYSKEHGRNRWYWIPSRVPDAEEQLADQMKRKAARVDRKAQRERMDALLRQ